MSSSTPATAQREGDRLGGARADFVASLGRKVSDSREMLGALEDDPTSRSARDEVRRRLHALGSAARLLRFEAMAKALQDALAVLDRGAAAGSLRRADLDFLAQVLDDLPALAWGEVPPRDAGSVLPERTEGSMGLAPIAVLVVGGEDTAEALTNEATGRAHAFECERTEEAQVALELARAYAPDILVVDVDIARAPALVEALLDDPLTEPVPIIVLGTFRLPDEAARFVALGVAKTLSKPVGREALVRACDEILDAREGRTVRVTLGEPTLEQLAMRLSEELRRALVDSVDRPALSCRVPLGEGTEVLGALWGAIARVQEIVTQKTGGAVRFGGDGPEGAIALAPWLHQDVSAADRLSTRGRGTAADVRLQGRRVVVADDDPGVTWFISDLLRTAGCEVYEALDGNHALDLAFRVQPELVVSDILMPGLDGFALSRAVHRDVALRDVPVILLSWKEDLLQRVRELGASAAAYMRKETDARAVLMRVREVLRPRARVEARIRTEGEVRGRLDGLTARLLLELVGTFRRDARVVVRDASYLFEIEIRDGAPRRATRTSPDGSYQSGERALTSLLGVGVGRFVVSSSIEPVRGELSGTLYEQVARPLAAARGALAATTGARTMNVDRIVIDESSLDEYLRATPDPARALIKRIAAGASPRLMILAGEVSPSLFEDVVSDLAARGAIQGVLGVGGTNLLGPAVNAALALLEGAPRVLNSMPLAARVSSRAPAGTGDGPPDVAPTRQPPAYESLQLSDPPPAPALSDDVDGPPSSLEDAVMREISDRSPNPAAAREPPSKPPQIVEPSELRKRSSNPPAVEPVVEVIARGTLPSIPPDAIVPAATISEEALAVAEAASDINGTAALEMATDDHTTEPISSSELAADTQPLVATSVAQVPSFVETARAAAPTEPRIVSSPLAPAQPPDLLPLAAGRPRRAWWGVVAAFAVLSVVVGFVLQANTEQTTEPSHATPLKAVPIPSASTTAVSSAVVAASSASAAASDTVPPGSEARVDQGIIEVRAPVGARIRLDGAIAGVGPLIQSVAGAGLHEVRVEKDGRTATQTVEVHAGRIVRIDSTTLP